MGMVATGNGSISKYIFDFEDENTVRVRKAKCVNGASLTEPVSLGMYHKDALDALEMIIERFIKYDGNLPTVRGSSVMVLAGTGDVLWGYGIESEHRMAYNFAMAAEMSTMNTEYDGQHREGHEALNGVVGCSWGTPRVVACY
jgi:hypothetical protein